MKFQFKIIIRIFILTFSLINVFYLGHSQEVTDISSKHVVSYKELEIGDSIPDFTIPKLTDNSGGKLRTSYYKDKLLILDFWATGCSGCVKSLPKFRQLEIQFNDKFKVLPITREKKAFVIDFLKKNKYTKHLNLTSVVEDTIFSNYFKHRGVPHEVWIYKGKVVAITADDYIDSNNIKKILSGQNVNWPKKNDFLYFDKYKSLFEIDTNQINTKSTANEYVAISGYRADLSSGGLIGGWGIVRDQNRKNVRVYLLNSSIYTAFELLFNYSGISKTMIKPSLNISNNQLVWKTSNQNRFKYYNKEISGYQQEWSIENSFCFESVQLDIGQTDQQIYKQVISELNLLFGLNVRWERKLEKVYILRKVLNNEPLVVLAKGVQSSDLVAELNSREDYPYIFDESGGKVILSESIFSLKKIDKINSAISKFGLYFLEQEKAVDKLVFEEAGQLLPDGKLVKEYRAKKTNENSLKIPDSIANINFLAHNSELPGVITLESGLQYKVIKKGNGPLISKVNNKVKVHYTGMDINGKIFESTLSTGLPKIFNIAAVIPGWIQALQIMPVGSKWIIYIPASLAYSSHTGEGKFLPNSTLIFEIELLEILP